MERLPEMLPCPKHLAERIRLARLTKNFTQDELAHHAGISTRHYQSIESGVVDFRYSTLKKVQRALDMPMQEILYDCSSSIYSQPENIFDKLCIGIQISLADGKVIYRNPAAKLLQCPELEERESLFLWDFLDNEVEKKDLKTYLDYLVTSLPQPKPYLARNRTAEGVVDVRVDWSYIFRSDGGVFGFFAQLRRALPGIEAP